MILAKFQEFANIFCPGLLTIYTYLTFDSPCARGDVAVNVPAIGHAREDLLEQVACCTHTHTHTQACNPSHAAKYRNKANLIAGLIPWTCNSLKRFVSFSFLSWWAVRHHVQKSKTVSQLDVPPKHDLSRPLTFCQQYVRTLRTQVYIYIYVLSQVPSPSITPSLVWVCLEFFCLSLYILVWLYTVLPNLANLVCFNMKNSADPSVPPESEPLAPLGLHALPAARCFNSRACRSGVQTCWNRVKPSLDVLNWTNVHSESMFCFYLRLISGSSIKQQKESARCLVVAKGRMRSQSSQRWIQTRRWSQMCWERHCPFWMQIDADRPPLQWWSRIHRRARWIDSRYLKHVFGVSIRNPPPSRMSSKIVWTLNINTIYTHIRACTV